MTSSRKIAANRKNAFLSTGPRSATGRTRVRFNALGSGLYAQTLLLPNEDVKAFNRLRQSVYAVYPPDGAIEEGLVEMVIGDLWRLNRFTLIENEFVERTRAARMGPPKCSASETNLRTFLNSIDVQLAKPANEDKPPDANASLLTNGMAAEALHQNLDGPGRILLEAFIPPVSQSPMEDIARQRGRTTRQLLRNLAALETLKERHPSITAN